MKRNFMKKKILLAAALLLSLVSCQDRQPIRVACVGDSITEGAGIRDRVRDSYPSLLQQMLGDAYDVRNFGKSGRTLLQKGDRPYINEPQYRQALDFQPDIVTIKLGTNDTKPFNWVYQEEFLPDLIQLVQSFQELPSHPKVYVCDPVPAYREDWGINDSLIHNGVQEYVRQAAAATGAEIIDLYTPFSGRPEWLWTRFIPTSRARSNWPNAFTGS